VVPEERQYGQFRLFGRSWPVAHSPTPLLSLIVILAPVAVLAFLGPRQWFLNTPVLWLGALVLTKILRGSMGRAPSLVRKLLKITISTLFALGLVILLTWDPIREWARRANPAVNAIWLFAVSLCVVVWQVSVVWILIARRKARQSPIASTPIAAPVAVAPQSPIKTIPKEHFNDVGGMEFAKERIREVIEAQLQPEKHRKYRVLRNGILLYGPRGTGKTLLGRAAAGEFRLNFEYVSAPSLYRRWIGATGENIRATFAQAAQRRPVLLFIDEIDSLGAGRGVGGSNDPGGAGREFDNITMQLFTAIDEYRAVDGFIIMAATNRVEAVDEAVIREGRFDVKIRVDLPDERTRLAIFEKQLAKRPWKPFALEDFARKTLGASGAKIEALVDRAAEFALAENRKIEGRDLLQALEASGGKDRPLSRYVSWDDVVIEESVLEDLRSLVRLINDPAKTENMGMSVPTGLLLIGPPGTGKTLIAELIASQTNRSFYPLTAADVLGGNTGD
jgi:transitional endoplasmic reticulum ATPase